MAKHKCKRRKLFNCRLKKVPVGIVFCTFLFILVFWRMISNFQYNRQVLLSTEEILSALGSRNCTQLVKPGEDTTVIKGGINVLVAGEESCYLIILVCSLPSNEIRRNIIRNTWARKEHAKETIVRFLMGKPNSPEEMTNLELESKLYGDIIVDDFEEHYYRLGVKSMRLLKWFLQNKLPGTQFLAKTDDDVYVNITNVISYLKQEVSASDTYSSFLGGQMYRDTRMDNDPYSKWYVPPQMMWDEEETLPPFVGGPFYLMHAEVAKNLIEKCQSVPVFHLEDVYICVVVGRHLKINIQNMPNVHSTIPKAYWPRIHYTYAKYFLETKSIVSYHTYSTPELMEIIYSSSVT